MNGCLPSIAAYSSSVLASDNEVEWKYNTETALFSITKRKGGNVFRNFEGTWSMSDFLRLVNVKHKGVVENYFSDISQGGKNPPLRLLMNVNRRNAAYCLINSALKEANIIGGTLTLLFQLPKRSQLSCLFLELFESQIFGVIISDKSSNIVAANEKYCQNLGYEPLDLMGKNTNILKSGKLNSTFYSELWNSLHFYGHWTGKILSKRRDGAIIPQEVVIQTLNFSPDTVYYIGICRDLHKQPSAIADTVNGGVELLTQLPDENMFKLKLESLVHRLKPGERVFTIAWEPNIPSDESFQYRKAVSKVHQLHEDKAICGHLGGDRFISAFTIGKSSLKKPEAIKRAMEPLIESYRDYMSKGCLSALGNANFGISMLEDDAGNERELFAHAILALEERHGSTGRGFSFYSEEIHRKKQRRARIESIIKWQISTESFEVYYQPIVDVSSWKVVKLEALCRFKDGSGSLINTQEAVSIAEEIGLAPELDLAVAKRAIADKEFLKSKFGNHVGVSINVSLRNKPDDLYSLRRVTNLINQQSIDDLNMTIEITESAYFDSGKSSGKLVNFLKAKGVSIAMDDFGKGYSTISYLGNASFDILKIDRKFISNIKEDSRNYHIVKMIIRLARTLGVKTVAEGIESLEDAITLYALGIDMLQGYYFSQPKPIDELSACSGSIYNLRKSLEDREADALYSPCITLEPQSTLRDVRDIYESTSLSTIPVVYEKRCVGIIDREIYNLHISHTLGTSIENTKDDSALNKTVNQVMSAKFTTVRGDLSPYQIVSNVKSNLPFPWIATNDVGYYTGMIEQSRILQFVVGL